MAEKRKKPETDPSEGTKTEEKVVMPYLSSGNPHYVETIDQVHDPSEVSACWRLIATINKSDKGVLLTAVEASKSNAEEYHDYKEALSNKLVERTGDKDDFYTNIKGLVFVYSNEAKKLPGILNSIATQGGVNQNIFRACFAHYLAGGRDDYSKTYYKSLLKVRALIQPPITTNTTFNTNYKLTSQFKSLKKRYGFKKRGYKKKGGYRKKGYKKKGFKKRYRKKY